MHQKLLNEIDNKKKDLRKTKEKWVKLLKLIFIKCMNSLRFLIEILQ